MLIIINIIINWTEPNSIQVKLNSSQLNSSQLHSAQLNSTGLDCSTTHLNN